MGIKKVFLDTSFFIRLMKESDEHYANAQTYFKRFQEKDATFFLSTIAIAEYGTGDDISHLPFRLYKTLPFNVNHAKVAALFAKTAFEAKRKGAISLENRIIIPNDTKLLAQAEVEKADLFLARDENFEKLAQFLKEKGLISFEFLDIRRAPGEYFGELF
jgi:predicted nucleic acid-binding protein